MDKDHDTVLLNYHLYFMLMSLVNQVFTKLCDAFIPISVLLALYRFVFLIVNLL